MSNAMATLRLNAQIGVVPGPRGAAHARLSAHGPAMCGPSRRIPLARPPTRRVISPMAASEQGAAPEPMCAVEGDVVTLHWQCTNEAGEVLESTRAAEDPTTFEVGAGDVVGNRLFEAFDEAVRGMAVGDTATLRLEGAPWQQELLFKVPRSHEEIQRLENRYKNQGGVVEGQLVELSNGGMAVVVSASEEEVVLDANSMMAGKTLAFELELVGLERP